MTAITATAIHPNCLASAGHPRIPELPLEELLARIDRATGTLRGRAQNLSRAAAGVLRPARSIRMTESAPPASTAMPAAPERSDEHLLADHLGGDRCAFACLVERYRGELHGFLARFLGSQAAADDVFQETFLQVHIAARSFDADRSFKPWLFTIAANKARDWHRRQKRRRAASLDAPAGGDPDAAPMVDLMESRAEAPSASLESSEVRQRVKGVVDGLPPIYREVLQLNYFQRMSYQQIADVLGVPLGTVKSRLHAAVATFAEAWKASEPRTAVGPAPGKESIA